jgi:hypothetical protein
MPGRDVYCFDDLQYQGPTLVILDECTSHASDELRDVCTRLGTITAFLPPHSSDQTQPMDRGLFAVQKFESKRIRPPDKLNVHARQGVKAWVRHESVYSE